MGDEPRRSCLAVARFASLSAFNWLYLVMNWTVCLQRWLKDSYSDMSSILNSILVGVLRIIATLSSVIEFALK